MEPSLPAISIQQAPHGVSKDGKAGVVGWIQKGTLMVLFGLVFGGVLTVAVLILPYNRIVVWPQPPSPNILISSVRLMDAGFIAIYLQEEMGLSLIGVSGYLLPGYRTRLVVPIDLDAIYGKGGRQFAVRLFNDTGDTLFSQQDDTEVRNAFGSIYQKKFSFLYPRGKVYQWLLVVLDSPFSVLADVLIP